MLYVDFLKEVCECPFCDHDKYKFIGDEHAFLTYSLAPYHPHHLLVIPKKHRLSIFDISQEEKGSIDVLLSRGMHLLRELGYDNFTVLIREGNNKARSVEHMHWHLIPNTQIGNLDTDHFKREVMNSRQIEMTVQTITEKMKILKI